MRGFKKNVDRLCNTNTNQANCREFIFSIHGDVS